MQAAAQAKSPAAFVAKECERSSTLSVQNIQEPESPHNVVLITQAEWSELLAKVEILKKADEVKTHRISNLERTVKALSEENEALRRQPAKDLPKLPRVQSPVAHNPHPQEPLPQRNTDDFREPAGEEEAKAQPKPKSYAAAVNTWSADVKKRLLEARKALIKANFVHRKAMVM